MLCYNCPMKKEDNNLKVEGKRSLKEKGEKYGRNECNRYSKVNRVAKKSRTHRRRNCRMS